jgi:hypothetical protein
MTRSEAISKYSDIVSLDILNEYTNADTHFGMNLNDSFLKSVYVKLPSPPKWKYIANFGLPAKDQIFQREKYPPRLTALERQVTMQMKHEQSTTKGSAGGQQKFIVKMWDTLYDNALEYKNEIAWIKKQWWHIINGYWFFCNGKPTYIDGWHFRYLNYYDMRDVKHPEYRDSDRRMYLWKKYLFTCTEDEKGNEIGRRTILGDANPKHRRKGSTHQDVCIGIDLSTTYANVDCGIQSFNNSNAIDVYKKKLIPAFKSLIWFLKPIWMGSKESTTGLFFTRPSNIDAEDLGSTFTYADNATSKSWEGKKMFYLLVDECGQTTLVDIQERHTKLKSTLCLGGAISIYGYMSCPSVAAEFDKGGGKNFLNFCKSSLFDKRNEDGTYQTPTGLITTFQSAADGLEEFIGKYGESIIDTPTKEQAKFIGKNFGAYQYIIDKLASLALTDIKEYQTFKVEHPLNFLDCFEIYNKDVNFDIVEIDKAKQRLQIEPNRVVMGNFYWVIQGDSKEYTAEEFLLKNINNSLDGVSKVVFRPDQNGLFEMSKTLPDNQTNCKFKKNGVWFSEFNDRFVAGGDTYKYLNKEDAKKLNDKSRRSRGGGAVWWERDYNLDPLDKDFNEWESYRYVCFYQNKPSDNVTVYCEQMLMMCVYFGSPIVVEMNIDNLYSHFDKRGYAGFLLYLLDPKTGMLRNQAGIYTLEKSKDDIFKWYEYYVKNHIRRERHLSIVEDCKNIRGVEDMGNYDRFTAGGLCGLGTLSRERINVKRERRKEERGNTGSGISAWYGNPHRY